MKKILFSSIVCLLFLTGCGDKKLTCSHVADEDGMTISDKIVLVFDKNGEDIQKVSMYGEFKVDEKYSEYLSDISLAAKEEYKTVEDIGGKVTTSTKDNTVIVEIDYKTQKLTDDQKSQLENDGVYFSGGYDYIKSRLEDRGYTCK